MFIDSFRNMTKFIGKIKIKTAFPTRKLNSDTFFLSFFIVNGETMHIFWVENVDINKKKKMFDRKWWIAIMFINDNLIDLCWSVIIPHTYTIYTRIKLWFIIINVGSPSLVAIGTLDRYSGYNHVPVFHYHNTVIMLTGLISTLVRVATQFSSAVEENKKIKNKCAII